MARPPFTTDQALRLDNQLCFALYSASLAMTKLYKPLLDGLGLTYPQYLVMLVLWQDDTESKGPGPMVSSLGERLSLDSGTLTPLLKRLEAAGLVSRVRAPEDQRRVHVQLSTAGRKLKARAAKVPSCVAQATACTLPELLALTAELQQLRQRLSP